MTLIIVTCAPGNEELCEEEIGNAIFSHDPFLEIRRTRHKGVLIVETRIDSLKSIRLLRSREYGFARRAVPLMKIVEPSVDNVVEEALSLLPEGIKEVCVYVRIRGIRGLSKGIWSRLRRALLDKGIRVRRDAGYCIYVEGVDNLIGVSLLRNREDRLAAGPVL